MMLNITKERAFVSTHIIVATTSSTIALNIISLMNYAPQCGLIEF